MYKRMFIFAAVIWTFAILTPAPAVSAGPGSLRVAFNTLPPWKILTEKGDITGIDIQFLYRVMQQMGLKIVFVQVPFKRGLKMMEAGTVDLMTGLLRRPERETYIAFVEPPYKTHSNKAFYHLKTNRIRLESYEDLSGLRIGTAIGNKYFPRFDKDRTLVKMPVPKNKTNFQKLLRGRLDLVIHTESTADYQLSELGLKDKIVKAPYMYQETNPVYFGISKRSFFMEKAAEFASHTRMLLEQGVLKKIKEDFLNRVRENVSEHGEK